MPDLDPSRITAVAVPPSAPTVGVTLPASPTVTVLPVPGVPGPPGPAGDDPDILAQLITAALDSHIANPTPHPAYDDMADLVLLFENGLS